VSLGLIAFEAFMQAFQDLRYIGELRQRWLEIKRSENGIVHDATAPC